MEVAYSHAQNQRLLKQRNLLLLAASALAVLAAILLLIGFSRDREVVLQPVLRSPLTISSAGVSREYLELITRDVVVLTLDRSPSNLEYWMESVLAIASPRSLNTDCKCAIATAVPTVAGFANTILSRTIAA